MKALETFAAASDQVADGTCGPLEDLHRLLIDRHLARVVVRPGTLEITARRSEEAPQETIKIAWTPPPGRRKRDIIVPPGVDAAVQRPIHLESRARLVEAIAKARHWLDQLISGELTDTREIAAREGTSERSVRMTLNLAFLSPKLAIAAIQGSLPYRAGVSHLTGLPIEWHKQLELGQTEPE